MKKIMIIILIASTMTAFGQKDKNYRNAQSDLSTEQKAILKTKRMALHLDLNDSQMKQMMEVNKKWAIEREKKMAEFKAQNTEELSPTDKFNRMNSKLDSQLAFQKEVKKILNDDQYDLWKKSANKKTQRSPERRGPHHQKGEKPMKPRN